jgi:hypothetical protein
MEHGNTEGSAAKWRSQAATVQHRNIASASQPTEVSAVVTSLL